MANMKIIYLNKTNINTIVGNTSSLNLIEIDK